MKVATAVPRQKVQFAILNLIADVCKNWTEFLDLCRQNGGAPAEHIELAQYHYAHQIYASLHLAVTTDDPGVKELGFIDSIRFTFDKLSEMSLVDTLVTMLNHARQYPDSLPGNRAIHQAIRELKIWPTYVKELKV